MASSWSHWKSLGTSCASEKAVVQRQSRCSKILIKDGRFSSKPIQGPVGRKADTPDDYGHPSAPTSTASPGTETSVPAALPGWVSTRCTALTLSMGRAAAIVSPLDGAFMGILRIANPGLSPSGPRS